MDSFQNTSNKINKLNRQSIKNENDLIQKLSKDTCSKSREYYLKTPKILYDSGYIGYPTTAIGGTATYGQQLGLYANPLFSKEINILREYLGYVKVNVMVKTPPDINVIGITDFRPMEYNGTQYSSGDAYQEIRGDSSLIYQGNQLSNGTQKYHTQAELNAGDFSESYTTKWWRGKNETGIYSLTWTTKEGTLYRWYYPTLYYVYSYWNVSLAGNGELNFSYWRGHSFTSVGSSSISGYGVYKTRTWVETTPGNWDSIDTVSVGYKSDVPLFQNTTAIGCNNGTLQYWTGSTWKQVSTSGDQIRYATTGGDFSGVLDDTITNFAFYEDDTYKLHWTTDKLGKQVGANGLGLINLPRSEDYNGYSSWAQGTPAPYDNINHKVNPDGYPIAELGDTNITIPQEYLCWSKTGDNLIFRLNMNNKIILSAPAKDEYFEEADVYNDYYPKSSYSYGTAIEDRTEKNLSLYRAIEQDIQVRILISLISPIDISDNKILKVTDE